MRLVHSHAMCRSGSASLRTEQNIAIRVGPRTITREERTKRPELHIGCRELHEG